MSQSTFLEMIPFWAQMRGYIVSASALVNAPTLMVMVAMLALTWFRYQENNKGRKAQQKPSVLLKIDDFPPIEELENFKWETTEPIKLRPFKPKYHLTMALENLDPSELMPMDKTYKDRIMHRRDLLKKFPEIVRRVNKSPTAPDSSSDEKEQQRQEEDPQVRAAISELYTFVMGIYLPTRYPLMFQLYPTQYETGPAIMVRNLVTGEILPTELGNRRKSEWALEILGKSVDEDMFVLLPEDRKSPLDGDVEKNEKEKKEKDKDNQTPIPSYILEAYISCFPSGFDPRAKLGKPLRDIHTPVPGYKEKLRTSMDRFFHKLEPGKFVKRVNWSVTTKEVGLFAPPGLGADVHGSVGERMKALEVGDLDVEKTLLRCERQTLYRLPRSKAIIFSLHTYTYPIRDVKGEDSGASAEEMAQAIDGLSAGSIPEIAVYKRAPVWGKAVKEYLRS